MRKGLLARLRRGDGRLIAVLMAYVVVLAGIAGLGASPALASHHLSVTCLQADDDGQPPAPASHPVAHCDWCFAGTTPAIDAPLPALPAVAAAPSSPAPAALSDQARHRLGWAAQPSRGPPSAA